MTSSQQITNGRSKTVIDYQEAPGQPWKVLDLTDFELQPLSGGGKSVTRNWGADFAGNEVYRGKSVTGNPAPFTGNAMFRETVYNFLEERLVARKTTSDCDKCGVNAPGLRWRYSCSDFTDPTEGEAFEMLHDFFVTSEQPTQNRRNGSTGDDNEQMRQVALDVAFLTRLKKLKHLDVSKTTSDIAFNQIRHVCNQSYVAVTDQDSTPGYQSQAVPIVWYTTDNWTTRNSSQVDVMFNADGTDILVTGGLVLVASPTAGVAYARYADLTDGTAEWALASWPTAGQFPNALAHIEGTIWAVGDGGYIWKSTDGGYTFSEVDAAATTTEDLDALAFESATQGVFVGANGTLLIYNNGAITSIATGLSDGLTTVSMPGRNGEIIFGTDAGEIWGTLDAFTATTPTFTEKGFANSGTGRIEQIIHLGYLGQVMFVLQSDADEDTRVLRDQSGGALGNNTEIVGAFTSPVNNRINAIAMADANNGFTVGEVEGSYAFIGQVTP